MKKIILMLMLLPNLAQASVVYTEYEEYLRGTGEIIEESELIKKEEEILYNTYIEEIEERYAKKNDLDDSYIIDLNNYYLEEKNNLDKTEYEVNYQTKCFNKYENITDIKVEGFSSNLNISEISYTSKDNTSMRLNVDNFKGDSQNMLYDKKLYEESIMLSEHSTITFRLIKTTDLDNLNLKLYFPKQGKKVIDFKITLNYSNNIYGKFELDDEDTEINITFDKLYKEFLINNNFQTEDNCLSFYRELIPYYKHTKINKIVLNKYKPFNDEELFLLDDYIKLYNYYKREKIEIKDNIILEKEKMNVSKYLTTSIPLENLTIIDNINYDTSGTYLIKIYYQNSLLLEHPIIYIAKEELTANNIKDEINVEYEESNNNIKERVIQESEKNYRTTKKSNRKKITSIKVTQSNKHMSKKRTTKNLENNKINKINNNIKTKSTDNKKIVIFTISLLILLLTIFEIILLYVKHKYF